MNLKAAVILFFWGLAGADHGIPEFGPITSIQTQLPPYLSILDLDWILGFTVEELLEETFWISTLNACHSDVSLHSCSALAEYVAVSPEILDLKIPSCLEEQIVALLVKYWKADAVARILTVSPTAFNYLNTCSSDDFLSLIIRSIIDDAEKFRKFLANLFISDPKFIQRVFIILFAEFEDELKRVDFRGLCNSPLSLKALIKAYSPNLKEKFDTIRDIIGKIVLDYCFKPNNVFDLNESNDYNRKTAFMEYTGAIFDYLHNEHEPSFELLEIEDAVELAMKKKNSRDLMKVVLEIPDCHEYFYSQQGFELVKNGDFEIFSNCQSKVPSKYFVAFASLLSCYLKNSTGVDPELFERLKNVRNFDLLSYETKFHDLFKSNSPEHLLTALASFKDIKDIPFGYLLNLLIIYKKDPGEFVFWLTAIIDSFPLSAELLLDVGMIWSKASFPCLMAVMASKYGDLFALTKDLDGHDIINWSLNDLLFMIRSKDAWRIFNKHAPVIGKCLFNFNGRPLLKKLLVHLSTKSEMKKFKKLTCKFQLSELFEKIERYGPLRGETLKLYGRYIKIFD